MLIVWSLKSKNVWPTPQHRLREFLSELRACILVLDNRFKSEFIFVN